MYKMVDYRYCLDECTGPVSDGYPLPAFLQRPHCLSERRSKLKPLNLHQLPSQSPRQTAMHRGVDVSVGGRAANPSSFSFKMAGY